MQSLYAPSVNNNIHFVEICGSQTFRWDYHFSKLLSRVLPAKKIGVLGMRLSCI